MSTEIRPTGVVDRPRPATSHVKGPEKDSPASSSAPRDRVTLGPREGPQRSSFWTDWLPAPADGRLERDPSRAWPGNVEVLTSAPQDRKTVEGYTGRLVKALDDAPSWRAAHDKVADKQLASV